MPITSAPTNAKAAQNIRIFTVCVSVIAFSVVFPRLVFHR
jgi:hypothetical protein